MTHNQDASRDFPWLHFPSPLPIPQHLLGEVRSKLAYVDDSIQSANVSEAEVSVQLNCAADIDFSQKLEQKIHHVITAMVKGAVRPKAQILEDHLDRPTPYNGDPLEELHQRDEITQEIQGVYSLGPLLSRLIEAFEAQFLRLAESFEAAPYRFPVLIPARYLERVNYFRAFPHSLSFATHLRSDLDVIDQFSQTAACSDQGLEVPGEAFAQFQTLLSPAVCYHLYFSLADQPLPGGKLAATSVGHCFRYEGINLTSLERLWDFTMREVIFVGPRDYVLENREIARQRMATYFEQIGLAYRVESANDPFFIGEFRKQAAFQSAFDLKFEIRASLPFKDSTLAVGSYNYHQDFFGRNLRISLPDGSPAHTGCVAFGLERIAFAYLAQYGLDPERWPTPMKEVL